MSFWSIILLLLIPSFIAPASFFAAAALGAQYVLAWIAVVGILLVHYVRVTEKRQAQGYETKLTHERIDKARDWWVEEVKKRTRNTKPRDS